MVAHIRGAASFVWRKQLMATKDGRLSPISSYIVSVLVTELKEAD